MVEIDLQLLNGGFEGSWREVDGIGELKVAQGWEPWWHETDTRPEYKIATVDVDRHRVHSGSAAQQWFNTYATHTAGIYQTVRSVPVGKNLVFTAFVQAFSRGDDRNFRESNGRYRMRIGLDPYGGTDAESKDVVWSKVVQPYDDWTELRVEATSRSDRCTLFLWGQPEWPVKHNNGYVDDCRLFYTDEQEPTPTPTPPVTPPTTPTPPSEDVTKVVQALIEFAQALSAAAEELARKLST